MACEMSETIKKQANHYRNNSNKMVIAPKQLLILVAIVCLTLRTSTVSDGQFLQGVQAVTLASGAEIQL